jgi:hypothetical protein
MFQTDPVFLESKQLLQEDHFMKCINIRTEIHVFSDTNL